MSMGTGKTPDELSLEELQGEASLSLNRLAKWRSVFAGWQLGTRPKGDPESDAVRDFQEARLLLRAEVNALTGLLIKKRVFTQAEWVAQLVEEAEALSLAFEGQFPGMTATDDGISYDKRAAVTMKGWKP